ncbi:MAG TPA: hypothetical protein DCW68_01270 [Rhodospirillaceae bacterium]|nr:MAG: hypothetical protein A2018_04235 [Alphaproteobacteria bacterium GWF2_58_20]HAU28729.1 hypothetical protein [Rhodospirillaceae bacterium]
MTQLQDVFRNVPILLSGLDAWSPEKMQTLLAAGNLPAREHSALLDEFQHKMHGLESFGRSLVVVLGQSVHLASPKATGAAIKAGMAGFHGASPLMFGLADEVSKTLHEQGAFENVAGVGNYPMSANMIFALENAGNVPLAQMIEQSPLVGIVFMDAACGNHYAAEMCVLHSTKLQGPQAQIMTARSILYHEAFGHGTESLDLMRGAEKGWRLANRELRADIAAMAGLCRDTGSLDDASTLIAVRDLAALRKAHVGKTHQVDFETDPACHANGHVLRKVLKEIADRGQDFARMSDAKLVAFIDAAHARHALSATAFAKRKKIVRKAQALAAAFLREGAPPLVRTPLEKEAARFMQACVQSLRHLQDIPPPSPRKRPKVPAPAMLWNA